MDKSPDAFRTISEVADFLETPAHVLRFWESRFPQIKPVKRAGGRRYYRPADVALLAGLRQLLHQDGMTIRGVQKILRDQGVRHVIGLSDPDFGSAMALDDRDDVDLAMVETGDEEDQSQSNIVALTDWRLGSTAGPPEAEPSPAIALPDPPPVLPLEAPESVPTGAIAPLFGASLVAEPEPRDDKEPDAEKETTLPSSAPLQWSLFDAVPSDAAAEPVAQDAAPLDETQIAPLASPSEAEIATAAPSLHDPTSSEPMPVAPPESLAAPEADSLRDSLQSPLSPPALAPAEAPPQDLPWLPPRLRALQGAHDTARQPEFRAILARACALHGRLREAAQDRRG